jgi:hypothetical protein
MAKAREKVDKKRTTFCISYYLPSIRINETFTNRVSIRPSSLEKKHSSTRLNSLGKKPASTRLNSLGKKHPSYMPNSLEEEVRVTEK